MAKRSIKRKWEPNKLKINQEKVSQERFEQLLAEVGELLYRRIRQRVSVQDEPKNTNSSTEPFLRPGNGTKTA